MLRLMLLLGLTLGWVWVRRVPIQGHECSWGFSSLTSSIDTGVDVSMTTFDVTENVLPIRLSIPKEV